jgi:Derlin-2/3
MGAIIAENKGLRGNQVPALLSAHPRPSFLNLMRAYLASLLFAAIASHSFPTVDGRRLTISPVRLSISVRIRSHFAITCRSVSSTQHSLRRHSSILIRGGAIDDDSDDGDGSMFDGFDVAAYDDFGDGSTMTSLIEAYTKTPPLTKAYLTASFGAAVLGYVTNGNDFPSLFQLEWKPILTRLQVWRPLTAFLNFGPLGLGYIMTAHFVWTYMSTLERLNHSKPYDFWLMIFVGMTSMVMGYSLMGLSPRFLGHNLSTFLVYVWSRYHEGLEVNMFELFNTRAELLPWFFLAQTFLLEGEVPILDFLGIVFGHIYHHYKSTNVLRTPKFVIQWYNGDNEYARILRGKYKAISSDFEMV